MNEHEFVEMGGEGANEHPFVWCKRTIMGCVQIE